MKGGSRRNNSASYQDPMKNTIIPGAIVLCIAFQKINLAQRAKELLIEADADLREADNISNAEGR
jgi:hypothetical protein